ncbi:MAG: LysR substrate-binding domain-containing protein [Symbiopectobacterium sp.]
MRRGKSYYIDIKEIFSSLNRATRKLQSRSNKGALTVSLLPSFAIHWLVPRLLSFNAKFPGIDVRIQAVDRQEDRLSDDWMWRFFTGEAPGMDCALKALCSEYLLPVCSPVLLTWQTSA